MKKTELLAPAGSFEALESVFMHGADAAYIGIGPFNLRAFSPNFNLDDLPLAIDLAQKKGKSLYAVLNIMPSDDHLEQIKPFLKKMSKLKSLPNAFIVADPGMIRICKKIFGNRVELHLSTQTGTFNIPDMEFWKEQGITRVVLPREMTIDQIAKCSKSGVCETEVFIHGAMCMSISGRCLLGAYIAGRHPNHGVCPQPCRYKYKIAPQQKDGNYPSEMFDVEEDENGTYIMNSKDLNTLDILPEIIKTGTNSLKIEGRNKSIHYVSSVIKTYRAAIDRFFDNSNSYEVSDLQKELDLLDHRDYTTGFYGDETVLQDHNSSKATSKIRVVGVVKAVLEGGRAVVDVKNPFVANEELSILPISSKKESYLTDFSVVYDLSGNIQDRAITNRLVTVDPEIKLSIGDIIRRVL